MTGLEHLAAGKVRDMYAAPDGLLLVVASDRISAYDHVLPTPIPDKGRVLTALSVWWFERLSDLVPHHLVSVDDPAIPAEWRGRAMLVRRLEMLPVECVARGYLTGSGPGVVPGRPARSAASRCRPGWTTGPGCRSRSSPRRRRRRSARTTRR